MSEKIISLSGAAEDVLHALFFQGALQSGELPSKSGAAVLRELGFTETRHTATEYQKENYFTFLTPEGQAFAVEHLVNTRFGVKVDGKGISSSITIGLELDMSNAQKAFDALEENIRNSQVFRVLKGEVFLTDMFIKDSIDVLAKAASAYPQDYKQHTVAGEITPATYTASMGISCNDIAEETLSAVLAAVLPGVQLSRTKEAAITVAGAVRAAFNALDEDNASPR